MTWSDVFAEYTELYALIAGTPMTPLRLNMAQILLRDRSVEEIRQVIHAVRDAAARGGRTAVRLMTKYENGSWKP